ncbi:MAG: dienelactone hydrolase family protein, partial [Candidatus Dadabacteria bacterium]|nr:dienelactone hydrolase family protein [Candidatus Dadabacteria bacterium]NIV42036.1 dienelactone hydrolase family protein [Candidatus Dadabacteria bacterium]NIX15299.1 dienelactone hydrolase family protein [Candidatus Dadabacteria bacterium]
PQEQVDAIKKEMADAEVDFTFVGYDGVQHSFTNPIATRVGKKYKIPLVYDRTADIKSWAYMQGYFKRIFSK